MKAISIQQPWAWAILAGHKRIENRTWRTPYRGRLLIHAGKKVDGRPETREFFQARGIVVPDELPRGAVLGSIDLTDVIAVVDVRDDPWAFGPWCFVCSTPELLATPIPLAGQLRMFNVADEILTS